MVKLTLLFVFLLVFSLPAFAFKIAGESDSNVLITPGTFFMTTTPGINEKLQVRFRIQDTNGNKLTNHHVEYQIRDSRNVKLLSTRECEIENEFISQNTSDFCFKVSDENGFVEFSQILWYNQFNIDQNYTLQVLAKNLNREERFTVKILEGKTGFGGDFMRMAAINAGFYFEAFMAFILAMILVFMVVIVGRFVWRTVVAH
jgi:hypothetical protein